MPLVDIQSISAGNNHACAVTTTGAVKCWGNNMYGALGDGTTVDQAYAVYVQGLDAEVAAVAAGSYHTCALTVNGGVKCWGANSSGQLGNGTTTGSSIPVDVTGLTSGVVSISAGTDVSCAVTAAGGVKCWGWNGTGQLGDGTTTHRSTPVDVTGLTSSAQAVTVGDSFTCALTTGGGVKCWGSNMYGRLGNGTTNNSSIPVDVVGLPSGAASLSLGAFHACAVTTTGAAQCWGLNSSGQLGDGTTTDHLIPIGVSDLASGVEKVSNGGVFTCALTAGGGVKCWGANYSSQLGDGTTTYSSIPVDVTGMGSGITMVDAGYSYACALTESGEVMCWGYNYYGQLGRGSTGGQSGVPSNVKTLGQEPPPIVTSTPTPSVTGMQEPSDTLTPSPTHTPALTQTPTPSPTDSPVLTATTTPTETETPTPTETPLLIATNTRTVTVTPTPT
jgi:alpha-tubulin suppressor-like RCC1 family protein